MKRFNIALLIAAGIILAVIILSGCKARKVVSEKKDSTTVSSEVKATSVNVSHIDTGKVQSAKTFEQKQESTSDDSTITWTKLKLVPGAIVTVDPNGTMHIPAEEMTTGSKSGKKSMITIDSKLQETVSELKGVSDTYRADSSSVKRDSVHVKSKTKQVDAKPSYGAWPWVAGIVIVVVVIIGVWWFFGRPKK